MATLRPSQDYFEAPLFGDDALHARVSFTGNHGWAWEVQSRIEGVWCVLDSGLAQTWNAGLHQVQRVIGELDTNGDGDAA